MSSSSSNNNNGSFQFSTSSAATTTRVGGRYSAGRAATSPTPTTLQEEFYNHALSTAFGRPSSSAGLQVPRARGVGPDGMVGVEGVPPSSMMMPSLASTDASLERGIPVMPAAAWSGAIPAFFATTPAMFGQTAAAVPPLPNPHAPPLPNPHVPRQLQQHQQQQQQQQQQWFSGPTAPVVLQSRGQYQQHQQLLSQQLPRPQAPYQLAIPPATTTGDNGANRTVTTTPSVHRSAVVAPPPFLSVAPPRHTFCPPVSSCGCGGCSGGCGVAGVSSNGAVTATPFGAVGAGAVPSNLARSYAGDLVGPAPMNPGALGGQFSHSGGSNGGKSSGRPGEGGSKQGSVFVPGYPLMVLQQQQQVAPVFTTPTTGFRPMAGVGEQMAMHPAAAAAMTASAAASTTVSCVPFPVQAFLQLNPLYPGLRRVCEAPSVFVIDDFFASLECDALMALANDYMVISPVVGAGAGEVSESRTSSSCFLAREDLPTVCSKVMALTGKPMDHLELPQVGRYYTSQKYANHWDAFDLNTEDGRRFAQNGGQRVCTVLVYLNNVAAGGCTNFPRLGMRVQPKKGMAVVFFPATLGGTLDPLLLHAAEPAIDTKWVSQIWIRQGTYHGTPTARIPRI